MLHVDMDSFFVSVELLDAPHLRGKPVAVGGAANRGVVASASYEARRFGVSSAMPVARARQLCPQLHVITPTFEKYRAASHAVMAIFHEFTPLVEPLSIDEAFLDVQGSMKLFGEPREIAQRIRERIYAETGLPASVGLAATKFVAKLASQKAKPDGLLEVHPTRTLDFLRPLPIEAMWGVGKATATKLRSRAIHTLGDLASEPLDSLERTVGKAAAAKLYALSRGDDPRVIETHRVEKSIGQEITFESDIRSLPALERELLRMSEKVGQRLRSQGVVARTVSIKLRWASFETVTRSRTLVEPSNVTRRIHLTALELLRALDPDGRPVRLLGVRGEGLMPEDDVVAGLWNDDERLRSLDQTVDEAKGKFGSMLGPARLLGGGREER
ncbi:MAG: DNA polymerase IV [Microbacteriaceae bacterium]